MKKVTIIVSNNFLKGAIFEDIKKWNKKATK